MLLAILPQFHWNHLLRQWFCLHADSKFFLNLSNVNFWKLYNRSNILYCLNNHHVNTCFLNFLLHFFLRMHLVSEIITNFLTKRVEQICLTEVKWHCNVSKMTIVQRSETFALERFWSYCFNQAGQCLLLFESSEQLYVFNLFLESFHRWLIAIDSYVHGKLNDFTFFHFLTFS